MTYLPLPPNTSLSPSQFADEMNKAITTLSGYLPSMSVCYDENGYWLEIDGVNQVGQEDLLSSASKLVLSK